MKNVLTYIILGYLFFMKWGNIAFTQNLEQHRIDSLLRIIPDASDAEKMEMLVSLGASYSAINPDSSIYYSEQGLSLARKLKNINLQAQALQDLGQAFDRKGDLVTAQNHVSKALALAKQGPDSKEKDKTLAHIHNTLGIIHAKRGEYGISLKYFIAAMEEWEKRGNNKTVGMLLTNIGTLYKLRKEYDQSLEALMKAKRMSEEIDNQRAVASCLHNIGDVYALQGDYKNALIYYKKALSLKRELGNKARQITTLKNMGELYAKMGLYQNSQQSLDEALEIVHEIGHRQYLQKIYHSFGRLKAAEDRPIKAIDYFLMSLEIAKEMTMKEEMLKLMDELAQTYESIEDFRSANSYLTQRRDLTDSIHDEKSRKLLAEMDTRFELNKKENEIKDLNREQETSQLKLWAVSAFALSILFALIASILFILNKRKANKLLIEYNTEIASHNQILAEKQLEITQQNQLLADQSQEIQHQNEQLKQSNTDLRQFAYAASHDLREPLRTIKSYLQLLERRYKNKLDQNAQEFIEFAVDGASRMDTLLQDLLAYSRIGRENAIKNTIDLNRILRKIEDSLHHQISLNEAQIKAPPLPYLEGYEHQIYLLFQNLISNAIKFRKEIPPIVEIDFRQENGHYLIMIADNGIGIEETHRERVFTLFQRLHPRSQYEGTGMGLAICKRIVQNHDGEIWVDSKVGEGSTFFMRLPVGNIHPPFTKDAEQKN